MQMLSSLNRSIVAKAELFHIHTYLYICVCLCAHKTIELTLKNTIVKRNYL